MTPLMFVGCALFGAAGWRIGWWATGLVVDTPQRWQATVDRASARRPRPAGISARRLTVITPIAVFVGAAIGVFITGAVVGDHKDAGPVAEYEPDRSGVLPPGIGGIPYPSVGAIVKDYPPEPNGVHYHCELGGAPVGIGGISIGGSFSSCSWRDMYGGLAPQPPVLNGPPSESP